MPGELMTVGISSYETIKLPKHLGTITHLWKMTMEANRSICLVPDGYIDILIPLRGGLQVEINNVHFYLREASLIGQCTSNIRCTSNGSSTVIGIKIHPWLLGPLLGFNARSIVNKLINCNGSTILKSFPNDAACLLFENEKFLEEILSWSHSSFKRLHGVNYSVAEGFNKGIQEYGGVDVHRLLDHLNCSRRYLENQFSFNLGLSPKQFYKILRVKKASLELAKKSSESILRKIAILEYFDYSHFSRDFKSLIGTSPSSYLEDLRSNKYPTDSSYLSQGRTPNRSIKYQFLPFCQHEF